MATETAIEKHEDVAPAEHIRAGRSFRANVDIIETGEELLLVADMPGAGAGDVDVHYENGQLSIHGKVDPRQDESNTNYLLHEYGVGDFHRTFQVGEGIDAARIAADMRNGVLTLHLPKAQEVLPRRIEVKSR